MPYAAIRCQFATNLQVITPYGRSRSQPTRWPFSLSTGTDREIATKQSEPPAKVCRTAYLYITVHVAALKLRNIATTCNRSIMLQYNGKNQCWLIRLHCESQEQLGEH